MLSEEASAGRVVVLVLMPVLVQMLSPDDSLLPEMRSNESRGDAAF